VKTNSAPWRGSSFIFSDASAYVSVRRSSFGEFEGRTAVAIFV